MISLPCFAVAAPFRNIPSFITKSKRVSNSHLRPSRLSQVIRLATSLSKTAETSVPDSTLLADIFRCPNCTTSLPPAPAQRLSTLPSECRNCSNEFPREKHFVDLTKSSGSSLPQPLKLLRDLRSNPIKQSLFQLPVVSYVYERGWRDSFARGGFPGIEKECDLLLNFAPQGDIILDLSCGSALMARQLAKKSTYRRVLAADYSEAMLREAGDIAARDVSVPKFDLLRADVNALPFQNEVFDTVSAGAALHCWPCVQDGLREVYRILKPGGRFFATTFSKGFLPSAGPMNSTASSMLRFISLAANFIPVPVPYRFFDEDELLYLFQAAGFSEVVVSMDKSFIMVQSSKAKK